MDAKALTDERKKTHGDWSKQAEVAQTLKSVVDKNDVNLTSGQREALDMICVKVSRILAGNPDEPDHWDDIAGYAYLGKGGHGK